MNYWHFYQKVASYNIKRISSRKTTKTVYSPADQARDGPKRRESEPNQESAFYRHSTHKDRVMWCQVSRAKLAPVTKIAASWRSEHTLEYSTAWHHIMLTNKNEMLAIMHDIEGLVDFCYTNTPSTLMLDNTGFKYIILLETLSFVAAQSSPV